MAKHQYLRCGEIINTHGVRGAVKVRSECDSPKILASLRHIYLDPNGDVAFDVVSASVMGHFVLLTLSGVNTLDAAAALKNKTIYAGRDELEEHIAPGAHFIADLIGLPLIHADTGEELGILKDVFNVGASDIYVVDTPRGEKMMPAVAEYVKEITDDAILVRPIEGMLD